MSLKFVGIIGSGLIGTDPFDSCSWSGSSRFFFNTCIRYGILKRAFGVEVEKYRRFKMMLRHFSLDVPLWKHKFYLDVKYYDALTREISKQLKLSDFSCNMLQLGGIYDVPGIMKGKTKCYSYHDGNLAEMLRSPYMPKNIPRAMIDKALNFEKIVYKNMTTIFTMSEYLRHSFIYDFGIKESRVKNIGAGINLDKIPPIMEKSYDNQEVLFIGVDFIRKGGFQLLEAFHHLKQSLPRAKLHIIGPDPKPLDIDTKFLKGVEFHGNLSKQKSDERNVFEDTIARCSLFVMPSLYEPFGIAPLEGMVYQIPCILTNRWAFPEMVQEGFNGNLVPCNDIEALYEAMKSMLRNPDLLRKMGESARSFVLENYTWDIVVKRLIKETETNNNGL